MSAQAGLAKRLEPQAGTRDDAVPVRPKVMRRPVHFSTGRPVLPAQPAFMSPETDDTPDLAALPFLPVPVAASSKPWQDDARFGAIMLAVVVVVNIALMLWLPYMRSNAHAVPAALVTQETAAPSVQPDNTNAAPVTLYTNGAPVEMPATTEEKPVVHVLGESISHPSADQ